MDVRSDNSPRRSAVIWGIAFAALLILTMTDHAIMSWKVRHIGSRDLTIELSALRCLGEPEALAIVVIVIAGVDRKGGRRAEQLVLAGLLALGLLYVGKFLVARQRPHYDELVQCASSSASWPFFSPDMQRAIHDARRSSFPSGHSTAVFAFAVTLAQFYPRGRVPFLMLATGCACSRFMQNAHWPSDCLAGVMIGSVSALLAQRIRHRLRIQPSFLVGAMGSASPPSVGYPAR